MKKNIFVMILAGLFLTSLVVLASNSSDVIPEEECVCLTPVSDTVRATGISLPDTIRLNLHLQDSMLYQLVPVITPTNAKMDIVKWSFLQSDNAVKIDQRGVLHIQSVSTRKTVKIQAKIGSVTASCIVIIENYINYSYGGFVPEYVEMAGVKWGTKNVGASSPIEVGKYFCWGETTGYYYEDGHVFDHEIDIPSGDSDGVTEHRDGNSLSIKQGGDYDAATANLGADWVMPTQEDFQALLDAHDDEVVWIRIDHDKYRFEESTVMSGWVVIRKNAAYYYPQQDYIGQEFIFLPDGGSIDGTNRKYHYEASQPTHSGKFLDTSATKRNLATLSPSPLITNNASSIYKDSTGVVLWSLGESVRPIYIGE